jgi:NCAIR mutase (PurE)-related protein
MEETLRALLEEIRAGSLSVPDGVRRIRGLAFEDLGFANLDHHRMLRRGFPEVVFAEGKTTEQTVRIVGHLLEREGSVLVTRAAPEVADALAAAHPGAERNDLARTVAWRIGPPTLPGKVLVVSAGTSDLPVAEEAAVTARAFGNAVDTLRDVGVAGIHRLLGQGEKLLDATVLVVAAGMEGALPSVVGGLTDVPVIAVPTSVGYGASFGGLAALLAMLNSCASGVTVVNIDNGFGAGCAASLVNRVLAKHAAARSPAAGAGDGTADGGAPRPAEGGAR